ncbi:MAG: beta-ketoacyl synthase N-terminal-like domain-containing protein [Acidimicrobiales bacterium]
MSLGETQVSVAGIGAVTGYGWGEKFVREGFYMSEPAIRPIPGFSPWYDHDEAWVAMVEDDGDPADGPSRMARAIRFSSREAIGDAHDRGWRPGRTVGLIHGIVLGDVDHWREYHHRQGMGTTKRGWLELMPSTVLMEVMKEFGFHGPTMAVTAMCASGVVGLLTAQLWIDNGIADDVVVIASDLSITPENCKSFGTLGPLQVGAPPTEVCRPFQEGSVGFNPGEASVAMVVSRNPGRPYARVLGGGMTHDAFHPISIAPDHAEVRRAFELACERAHIEPADIAYLNAHGTGTAQCDMVEAAILDELLTGATGIFSMKPLVGHCQGASGAVELLASFYGFETGVIPAPPRVSKGHPRLLDGLTAAVEGPVAKSSLGMGGHNAVVILDAPAPAS